MKILVTGGRDYANAALVHSVLQEYDDPTIIVGDAKGADTLAKESAESLGFRTEVFFASWSMYGKRAGPIRNAEMISQNPDLVIAFPGGKGTADCVARAEKAGIPIRDERDPASR